jgi:hypothetical protein
MLDIHKIRNYINEKKILNLINYFYDNLEFIINFYKNNKIFNLEKVDILNYINYNDISPIILNRLIQYIIKKNKKFIFIENNSTYFAIICDNDVRIKLMILQIIYFHYEAKYKYIQNPKNNYFVGLDYEFYKQQINLCQMSLFPRNKTKYIWIFEPNKLNITQKKIINKYIYYSNYIYKILHGAESLDIPYLFIQVFDKKKSNILKFLRKVIDNKFLCEYQQIINNNKIVKCNLYNALKYFDVIDDKKLDVLNNISNKINYNTIWKLNNINDNMLYYAIYDTLYLRDYLFNILKKAKKDNTDKYTNISIIPEFTRFIYLERFQVTNLINDLKIHTDYLSNITLKNQEFREYYNKIINILDCKVDFFINLNDFLKINYFKNPLDILFKYIIYYLLIEKFNYDYKLDIKIIFSFFNNHNMKKIIKFINDIIICVKKTINNLYSL